jgi:hypothetical protein
MNGLRSLMTGLALATRLIHFQTLQMEHGILFLLMAIHMPDLQQMLPIPILCKMSTMEKNVFIHLDLTQPGSLIQITFSQFKIALR